MLADVSLCADGYWGDTAETHAARGGPAAALREGLLDVLDATAAELRPGRAGPRVFAGDGGADRRALPERRTSRTTPGTASA